MGLLETIKDQVALEKRGVRFDTLLYDMYPDDTYVYEVDRWDIDEIMSEAASRYAKAVAEDALKRAAENAGLIDTSMNIRCKSGHGFVVDKQSILSTPINLEL